MAGRTLLPGFIDSHSRISGMANVEASYIDVQVPPLKDAAAIIARLETAQTTRPRGAWLIGQGTYNQVMPPRAALDAAVPDNPSIQWNVHHHLINHAVAVATGMGATFPIRRRAPPDAMSAPPRARSWCGIRSAPPRGSSGW